jgi:hypothetical protein
VDAPDRPGLSSSIAQPAQALRAARADLGGRSETMEDEPKHRVVTEEEELVAELDLLGIRYLSRQSSYQANQVRSPENLLVSHPDYAEAVPAALRRLSSRDCLTLQSFYTAAVLLQQEYADRLRPLVGGCRRWLPDLLSKELGLPTEGAPRERLRLLDRELRHRTQAAVNWMGTYEQVVQKLIRRLGESGR